jgi:hypothetical protein
MPLAVSHPGQLASAPVFEDHGPASAAMRWATCSSGSTPSLRSELCVAEMAKFESQMWPEHLADLAIARAQLKARWVELDQTYRARRRAKAQVIWSGVKRLLIWGFVFWFVLTFMKGAQAQSTLRSFYNERGSFAGSSVTRGNSSSFYDGQGRFSGSAIRHGNSTSFYDRNGHYTGSVIDTLPKR